MDLKGFSRFTHISEYVSMQWEKLCWDAVTGNIVNGVVYGKAKRWWGSVLNEDKKPEQVEFDVMAESLDKKYLKNTPKDDVGNVMLPENVVKTMR